MGNRKKEEKTKKVLDFWGKRWYSIKAVARDSPDGGTGRKEFEKKFLTSPKLCDIIAELTRADEELASVHLVN